MFQRCLPDDGVCAIYSVGLDGGGLRALTQFKPGPNEANDYWPTVAPDGRIAFGRFSAGGSPPRCTAPGPEPQLTGPCGTRAGLHKRAGR